MNKKTKILLAVLVFVIIACGAFLVIQKRSNKNLGASIYGAASTKNVSDIYTWNAGNSTCYFSYNLYDDNGSVGATVSVPLPGISSKAACLALVSVSAPASIPLSKAGGASSVEVARKDKGEVIAPPPIWAISATGVEGCWKIIKDGSVVIWARIYTDKEHCPKTIAAGSAGLTGMTLLRMSPFEKTSFENGSNVVSVAGSGSGTNSSKRSSKEAGTTSGSIRVWQQSTVGGDWACFEQYTVGNTTYNVLLPFVKSAAQCSALLHAHHQDSVISTTDAAAPSNKDKVVVPGER